MHYLVYINFLPLPYHPDFSYSYHYFFQHHSNLSTYFDKFIFLIKKNFRILAFRPDSKTMIMVNDLHYFTQHPSSLRYGHNQFLSLFFYQINFSIFILQICKQQNWLILMLPLTNITLLIAEFITFSIFTSCNRRYLLYAQFL